MVYTTFTNFSMKYLVMCNVNTDNPRNNYYIFWFNYASLAFCRDDQFAFHTFLLAPDFNWASSRENLSSGFPTKRVSNRSPQLQRLARKLKFYLIRGKIWYFPKREQQRRRSDCADAQAGLRLCCSQTPEDRFSCFAAQLVCVQQGSCTLRSVD